MGCLHIYIGSIPGRVIPKTFKMVLDTSLLNTQQYKVGIKGKVEKSRERSSALDYTSVLQLLKRELSGRPDYSRQLLPIYIYIYIYIYLSSIRVAYIDENKNSHRKITMTSTQTRSINRIALRAGKKGARPAEVGALASVFEKISYRAQTQT